MIAQLSAMDARKSGWMSPRRRAPLNGGMDIAPPACFNPSRLAFPLLRTAWGRGRAADRNKALNINTTARPILIRPDLSTRRLEDGCGGPPCRCPAWTWDTTVWVRRGRLIISLFSPLYRHGGPAMLTMACRIGIQAVVALRRNAVPRSSPSMNKAAWIGTGALAVSLFSPFDRYGGLPMLTADRRMENPDRIGLRRAVLSTFKTPFGQAGHRIHIHAVVRLRRACFPGAELS